MNPNIARFVFTSPAWLLLLGMATMTDFMFFPYYRHIGCDPAEKISDAAFKLMCG